VLILALNLIRYKKDINHREHREKIRPGFDNKIKGGEEDAQPFYA